jgi:hypothetical protein
VEEIIEQLTEGIEMEGPKDPNSKLENLFEQPVKEGDARGTTATEEGQKSPEAFYKEMCNKYNSPATNLPAADATAREKELKEKERQLDQKAGIESQLEEQPADEKIALIEERVRGIVTKVIDGNGKSKAVWDFLTVPEMAFAYVLAANERIWGDKARRNYSKFEEVKKKDWRFALRLVELELGSVENARKTRGLEENRYLGDSIKRRISGRKIQRDVEDFAEIFRRENLKVTEYAGKLDLITSDIETAKQNPAYRASLCMLYDRQSKIQQDLLAATARRTSSERTIADLQRDVESIYSEVNSTDIQSGRSGKGEEQLYETEEILKDLKRELVHYGELLRLTPKTQSWAVASPQVWFDIAKDSYDKAKNGSPVAVTADFLPKHDYVSDEDVDQIRAIRSDKLADAEQTRSDLDKKLTNRGQASVESALKWNRGHQM